MEKDEVPTQLMYKPLPESLTIKACQNCFGPYKFVETITNNFIHYLHLKRPKISNHEFGNVVNTLLERKNHAMASKDIAALRKCVSDTFNAVNRGDKTNLDQIKVEGKNKAHY